MGGDDGRPKYRRVLLKLSGEAFADEQNSISPTVVASIARQLVDVSELGVEIGVVVGGGNIFRGTSPQASGMDRSSADHMGMLATVINALALQDFCEKRGLQTRVQSAVSMQELCEPYIRRRAVRHLEKGRLVIFGGLLPQPTEDYPHWFGLDPYTLSVPGQQLLLCLQLLT